MLHNHLYNLMMQMVEENKSLWRIKNMYRKDSKGCKACKALWDRFEKHKEQFIKDLEDSIKNHLK